METVPSSRPLSRPTQAYYVPRKLLECGRGPVPKEGVGKIESKTEKKNVVKSSTSDRSQSPKETNNNEKKENVKPKKSPQTQKNTKNRIEPRPLMAELVSKPDSLKNKRSNHRKPPSSDNLVSPVILVEKVQGLTMSEPRVISPKNGASSLVKSTVYFPKSETKQSDAKQNCICQRPESHVICRRCGHETIARVATVCDMHPLKMSLMDLQECPNSICRSIQIFESPDFQLSQ